MLWNSGAARRVRRAGGATAVLLREEPHAQADGGGRHLDQLIGREELDGRLERQQPRRGEDALVAIGRDGVPTLDASSALRLALESLLLLTRVCGTHLIQVVAQFTGVEPFLQTALTFLALPGRRQDGIGPIRAHHHHTVSIENHQIS